ncbi:hypothetical protein SynA1560_01645 [Synechococcus sp. A15-60]|nr:hypothetical protein SynA1560_01645 [Synechococcus sp. A15-60]
MMIGSNITTICSTIQGSKATEREQRTITIINHDWIDPCQAQGTHLSEADGLGS